MAGKATNRRTKRPASQTVSQPSSTALQQALSPPFPAHSSGSQLVQNRTFSAEDDDQKKKDRLVNHNRTFEDLYISNYFKAVLERNKQNSQEPREAFFTCVKVLVKDTLAPVYPDRFVEDSLEPIGVQPIESFFRYFQHFVRGDRKVFQVLYDFGLDEVNATWINNHIIPSGLVFVQPVNIYEYRASTEILRGYYYYFGRYVVAEAFLISTFPLQVVFPRSLSSLAIVPKKSALTDPQAKMTKKARNKAKKGNKKATVAAGMPEAAKTSQQEPTPALKAADFGFEDPMPHDPIDDMLGGKMTKSDAACMLAHVYLVPEKGPWAGPDTGTFKETGPFMELPTLNDAKLIKDIMKGDKLVFPDWNPSPLDHLDAQPPADDPHPIFNGRRKLKLTKEFPCWLRVYWMKRDALLRQIEIELGPLVAARMQITVDLLGVGEINPREAMRTFIHLLGEKPILLMHAGSLGLPHFWIDVIVSDCNLFGNKFYLYAFISPKSISYYYNSGIESLDVAVYHSRHPHPTDMRPNGDYMPIHREYVESLFLTIFGSKVLHLDPRFPLGPAITFDCYRRSHLVYSEQWEAMCESFNKEPFCVQFRTMFSKLTGIPSNLKSIYCTKTNDYYTGLLHRFREGDQTLTIDESMKFGAWMELRTIHHSKNLLKFMRSSGHATNEQINLEFIDDESGAYQLPSYVTGTALKEMVTRGTIPIAWAKWADIVDTDWMPGGPPQTETDDLLRIPTVESFIPRHQLLDIFGNPSGPQGVSEAWKEKLRIHGLWPLPLCKRAGEDMKFLFTDDALRTDFSLSFSHLEEKPNTEITLTSLYILRGDIPAVGEEEPEDADEPADPAKEAKAPIPAAKPATAAPPATTGPNKKTQKKKEKKAAKKAAATAATAAAVHKIATPTVINDRDVSDNEHSVIIDLRTEEEKKPLPKTWDGVLKHPEIPKPYNMNLMGPIDASAPVIPSVVATDTNPATGISQSILKTGDSSRLVTTQPSDFIFPSTDGNPNGGAEGLYGYDSNGNQLYSIGEHLIREGAELNRWMLMQRGVDVGPPAASKVEEKERPRTQEALKPDSENLEILAEAAKAVDPATWTRVEQVQGSNVDGFLLDKIDEPRVRDIAHAVSRKMKKTPGKK